MKISMDIANGYKRSKIAQLTHDYPDLDLDEVTAKFVDQQYETWIKANLTGGYTVLNVTADAFKLEFENGDDAASFTALIGGRVVED